MSAAAIPGALTPFTAAAPGQGRPCQPCAARVELSRQSRRAGARDHEPAPERDGQASAPVIPAAMRAEGPNAITATGSTINARARHPREPDRQREVRAERDAMGFSHRIRVQIPSPAAPRRRSGS